MGHQSYVLPYKNEQEKKRILQVIKEHNEFDDTDWENPKVGEGLYGIVDAPMQDGPWTGDTYGYPFTWLGSILCGHGGGRTSTFKWFQDHEVLAFPYGHEPFEIVSEDKYVDIASESEVNCFELPE